MREKHCISGRAAQIPGYVAPENATVGLDAGTITVSTPVGPYTLYQIPSQTGTYDLVFLPGGRRCNKSSATALV